MNDTQYWNDLPELFKSLSTDSHAAYSYSNGTYMTKPFNQFDQIPKSFRQAIEQQKDKRDIYDVVVFMSLSDCKGIGWHTDPDDVLIQGLYGASQYEVEVKGCGSLYVRLEAGETLYLPKGTPHIGLGDRYPRVALTMGVHSQVKREDVTYYSGKNTNQK